MRGCKVYGAVLDVFSPRYVCPNCELAILGEQHLEGSVFLRELSKFLKGQECQLSSKKGLRMITRVSSVRPCNGRELVTPKQHEAMAIELRACGNRYILQRDVTQRDEMLTQFESTNTAPSGF